MQPWQLKASDGPEMEESPTVSQEAWEIGRAFVITAIFIVSKR